MTQSVHASTPRVSSSTRARHDLSDRTPRSCLPSCSMFDLYLLASSGPH